MNRSWKKEGLKRHASNLRPSHKKTTRNIRQEKNAYGTKDFGASPSTTLVQIRQRPANVKTFLELFRNFVRGHVLLSLVVKTSVLINHPHNALTSRNSSAHSLMLLAH